LREGLPDAILLDIELGKSNGVEVCRELKIQYPDIKIIALTSYSDTYTVKSSAKAGFDGYLLKSDDRQTVMAALQTVTSGEVFYSPKVKDLFFQQSISNNKTSLTKREEDILRLIVEEKTTKEIGENICIYVETVENYRYCKIFKLEDKKMMYLDISEISRSLV